MSVLLSLLIEMDVEQNVSYELQLLQLPWVAASINGHNEEVHEDFTVNAAENFSYEQGLLDWAYNGTQEQFNFVPEYVHQSFSQVLRDADIRSIHRALDETRSEGLRLYWLLREQILGYERSLHAEQNNGQFIAFDEDEVYTQLTGIPLEVAREYLREHGDVENNGHQAAVEEDRREIEEEGHGIWDDGMSEDELAIVHDGEEVSDSELGDEVSDDEENEDELDGILNEDEVSDSELGNEVSDDEESEDEFAVVDDEDEISDSKLSDEVSADEEEGELDKVREPANAVEDMVEVDEEICKECDICELVIGDSWRAINQTCEQAYRLAMDYEVSMKFSQDCSEYVEDGDRCSADKNAMVMVQKAVLVDSFAAVGRYMVSLLEDIENGIASEAETDDLIAGDVEVPAIINSTAEISCHVNKTVAVTKNNEREEEVDQILEKVLRAGLTIRELVLSDLHQRTDAKQKKHSDAHCCLMNQDGTRCDTNKTSNRRRSSLDKGHDDFNSPSRLKFVHRYQNNRNESEFTELLNFGLRSAINIGARQQQCIGGIATGIPNAFNHDNVNNSVATNEAKVDAKKPSLLKRIWRACTRVFRKRQ